MALELWLIAIVFIVGVSLILKFVKKFFKAAGFIVLLFVILNLAFSFLVFKDVMDLKENFFEQPSVYALEKDGKFVAAVSFAFPKEGGEPDFKISAKEELDRYSEALAQENLEGIKGTNYKLFLMNDVFVEALVTDDIVLGEAKIPREVLLEAIYSDKGFDFLLGQMTGGVDISLLGDSQKQQILQQMGLEDQSQVSGMFFMMGVVQGMFSQGPEGMLTAMEQIKKGNMIIYKETMFFKIFKIVPISFMRKAMEKAMSGAEGALDKIKETAE